MNGVSDNTWMHVSIWLTVLPHFATLTNRKHEIKCDSLPKASFKSEQFEVHAAGKWMETMSDRKLEKMHHML